jgi:hypothetical protein
MPAKLIARAADGVAFKATGYGMFAASETD